jgi:hypothetical protein
MPQILTCLQNVYTFFYRVLHDNNVYVSSVHGNDLHDLYGQKSGATPSLALAKNLMKNSFIMIPPVTACIKVTKERGKSDGQVESGMYFATY